MSLTLSCFGITTLPNSVLLPVNQVSKVMLLLVGGSPVAVMFIPKLVHHQNGGKLSFTATLNDPQHLSMASQYNLICAWLRCTLTGVVCPPESLETRLHHRS